MQISQNK